MPEVAFEESEGPGLSPEGPPTCLTVVIEEEEGNDDLFGGGWVTTVSESGDEVRRASYFADRKSPAFVQHDWSLDRDKDPVIGTA